MHGDGLLDDEAIGDELADRLAGVGVGDLADLVGVEPNLALTAAQDGRRQALLGPQVNPTEPKTSASCRSVCIFFFFDGRVCLEVCMCVCVLDGNRGFDKGCIFGGSFGLHGGVGHRAPQTRRPLKCGRSVMVGIGRIDDGWYSHLDGLML